MAKKILLVEYEPRYIDRVRASAGRDYDVAVARDGDEAAESFEQSRPDVVLISAVLPKSRTNDVIRELRRKGGAAAPPIIITMSGYKGTNPKADAQKIGAFDILEKPFDDQRLLDIVKEALASTEAGSRTVRIDLKQAGTLTSSDIFSDVLEDLQPEAKAARPTPPAVRRPTTPLDADLLAAPAAAPRPAPRPDTSMDKRLEDTLSGILPTGKRPTAPPAPSAPRPSAPPAPAVAPPPPIRPTVPEAPKVPSPPPVLRPPAAAPPAAVTAPPAASAARPPARQSTDLEVENMISQTLSGLSKPASKPRPTSVPPPPPPPPRPMAAPPAPPARPSAAAPAPVRTSRPSQGADKDRFGQFQLIEKIATGGMAEVYKARMSGVDGFQKIVAIKKILPHMAASEDFITMFADEAKLAAQLNHPNIIHIYDLGKVEDSYYIAMEYVEGRDLRSILKSGAEHGLPLPPELALFIASKLAAALDYAHRRKDFEGQDLSLVHRDVSPQNVLISYEGDIKLCDFGIAKAASKSSQTQAGALKGKLQYMSPEQASGNKIDRRSDLFSLGSVLHEMLTGEKLFAGDTDLSVLEQVRNAKAEPPSARNPEIPKRIDSIVLKALAKNPEDRYQNASDFQRDLESVLYTFSPAPGSADLAIYLHHLQAEENAAASETDKAFDSAFTPLPSAPSAPAKPKKAKGTVVQRKTGTGVNIPAPPPAPPPVEKPATAAPSPTVHDTKSGVFGAYSSSRIEAEKKGRTPLYAGIGAAALVLVGLVVFLTRRGSRPAPAPAPAATTATATPGAATAGSATSATPAASTLTEKQVEEEVKKQLAQKQKDLEKQQAVQKGKEAKAGKQATSTASPPAEASAPSPEAAAKPPAGKPAAAPAPTPVPVKVAQAQPTAIAVPSKIEPAAPPPAGEAPKAVSRGDLVGPGPGVVEPELSSGLAVNYPPAARQERVAGRVVILALIDENGRVQSARMQTGVASRTGVNEAVVDAVKRARFRPATKDGVPVKMWKAIPVEVKP
jgi:TonB family protein